ncbi:MAG: patatin-like phospholipase family protein [Clostridiales bacterium]|nr:patatin-like phospholipase family protein [Clostridiales bacterium]
MSGKRAVVLSGGGAKGGYQIGAWQALRELNFSPDIVTGTSVGSFNGALMVLDKYDEALKLWENICMEDVFTQFLENADYNDQNHDGYIKKLTIEALRKGGVDFSPLNNIIKSLVDEDALRKSPIEFGLVTTKFPNKKQIERFIDAIPQGEAIDYIIASASAFPLVRSYKIGDTKYIDGGYSDNMPIQMALDRGAEEVVAVNIGRMPVKKLKENCAEIHYVQNRRLFNNGQFGTVAIFDKKLSTNNIRQGYLDTCKAFKLLDGEYYCFEKLECYNVYAYEGFCTKKFDSIFSVLPSDNRFERIGRQKVIELIHSYKHNPFESNAAALFCAELAAEIFELDPQKIYTLQEMVDHLVFEAGALIVEDSTSAIASLTRELDKGLSLDLLKTVLKSWDKKLITGFCLQLLLEDKLGLSQKRRLWLVAALMPEAFCAAIFCSAALLKAKPQKINC